MDSDGSTPGPPDMTITERVRGTILELANMTVGEKVRGTTPGKEGDLHQSERYIARLDIHSSDARYVIFWRKGSIGESLAVPLAEVGELARLLLGFDAGSDGES